MEKPPKPPWKVQQTCPKKMFVEKADDRLLQTYF